MIKRYREGGKRGRRQGRETERAHGRRQRHFTTSDKVCAKQSSEAVNSHAHRFQDLNVAFVIEKGSRAADRKGKSP